MSGGSWTIGYQELVPTLHVRNLCFDPISDEGLLVSGRILAEKKCWGRWIGNSRVQNLKEIV